MGRLDYVRCDYPLPDPEHQGDMFQTKQFEKVMCTLIITKEGTLISEDWQIWAHPDDRGQPIPFHGKMRIVSWSEAPVEYMIHFERGKVSSIERM